MRIAVLAALALVGLLSACTSPGSSMVYTDSVTGHFGAGMHAGRVSGQ